MPNEIKHIKARDIPDADIRRMHREATTSFDNLRIYLKQIDAATGESAPCEMVRNLVASINRKAINLHAHSTRVYEKVAEKSTKRRSDADANKKRLLNSF